MADFIKDKKIFIFDTNVVLHDYRAIHSFEKTNLVIPMTVLEEIDKFKRGSDTINYNAREFIRELDELASKNDGKNIFSSGLELTNGGRIFVDTENYENKMINSLFHSNIADHRILSVAYNLKEKYSTRVVLISKDINMRMKAKSLDIETRDYYTDKIEVLSSLFTGVKNFVGDEYKDIIKKLKENNEIKNYIEDIFPNTYISYKVKTEDEAIVAKYIKSTDTIKLLNTEITAYGVKPRNNEQLMALDALLDKDIPLISMTGKAGTGKTLLALAAALEKRKSYRQILLARPVVALSNKDIGFLPGDIKSKLDPYMQPLFDNLSVIQNIHGESSTEHQSIKLMLENEKLVISPLAYIRGRSLSKMYFIIDEAQNLTPHEVKTIITRAGENTKIVFTGDIHQIDTPYLDERSNGLTYLIDRMKAEELNATVTLEKGERSKLAELAANIL